MLLQDLLEGKRSLRHSCRCLSAAAGCRPDLPGILGPPLGSPVNLGDDIYPAVCKQQGQLEGIGVEGRSSLPQQLAAQFAGSVMSRLLRRQL